MQDVRGAADPRQQPGDGRRSGRLRLLPSVRRHPAGAKRDQIYPSVRSLRSLRGHSFTQFAVIVRRIYLFCMIKENRDLQS